MEFPKGARFLKGGGSYRKESTELDRLWAAALARNPVSEAELAALRLLREDLERRYPTKTLVMPDGLEISIPPSVYDGCTVVGLPAPRISKERPRGAEG